MQKKIIIILTCLFSSLSLSSELNILKKGIPDHENNIKTIRESIQLHQDSNIIPLENSSIYTVKDGSSSYLIDKTGTYVIKGKSLKIVDGKISKVSTNENRQFFSKINAFRDDKLITYKAENEKDKVERKY